MSEEEHRETELEAELDDLYRKTAVLDTPEDSRSPEELEVELETLSGPDFPEPREAEPEQEKKRLKRSLSKLQSIFASAGTTILSIMRSLTPRRAAGRARAAGFKFRLSRRAAALAVALLFLGAIVFFAWPWISRDNTIDRSGVVQREEINRTAAEAMRDTRKEPPPASVVTEVITPQAEEVKVPAAALPAAEKEDNKKITPIFDVPSARRGREAAMPLQPPAVTGMTTPQAEEVKVPVPALPAAEKKDTKKITPIFDLPSARRSREAAAPLQPPAATGMTTPQAEEAKVPVAALPAGKKEDNRKKRPVVARPSASQRGKYAIQIRAYPENRKQDAIAFLEDVRKREPDVAMETVQVAGRGVWHRILIGNFSTAHEAAAYREKHRLARTHPGSFIQRRSESRP